MPKILHTADFHLDAPFSAHGQKAATRRAELREAIKRIGALVKKEKVDIALFCGDLFDGECVYTDTVELLAEEFSKLSGTKIFISPGNHDYYSSKSPYARNIWPENVHIFKSREIERVFLPEHNTAVYGAAFMSEHEVNSLLRGFCAENREEISVMALHAELSTKSGYNPITEKEIAESGLDFLALGHIHQASKLMRAGNTFYAYCGCPQGRGFDELGVKGVNILDVQKGSVKCDFHALGGRTYNIVSVDISTAESQSDIKRAVLDSGAFGRENCIRFVLTGESELIPDVSGLLSDLNEMFFIAEVIDKTGSPRESKKYDGDTFSSIAVGKLTQLFDNTSEDDREVVSLAIKYLTCLIEEREVPSV